MTSTPTVVRIRAICIDHARTISTKAVFPVDMPFISQNGLETEVYHLVEKVLTPSPLVIANATVWKLKHPKPLPSFSPKIISQTQKKEKDNMNDIQQSRARERTRPIYASNVHMPAFKPPLGAREGRCPWLSPWRPTT